MQVEKTTLEDLVTEAYEVLVLLGCQGKVQITDSISLESYQMQGWEKPREIPEQTAERLLSFVRRERTLEDVQRAYREVRNNKNTQSDLFRGLISLNNDYIEEMRYNDEYFDKGRCDVRGFTLRLKGDSFGYSTLFKNRFQNYSYTQTMVESVPVMLSRLLFPGDLKINILEAFSPRLEEYSQDVLNVDRIYMRPSLKYLRLMRLYGYTHYTKTFEFPAEGIVGQRESRVARDIFYKDL